MKKMFTSALATGALLLAVGFSAPAMAEDAAAPAAAPAAEAVVVVTETQARHLLPRRRLRQHLKLY
jgi:Amt family ammonium transporter